MVIMTTTTTMSRLILFAACFAMVSGANSTASWDTCGFITVPLGFNNPTDWYVCGYVWFRDFAMAELWSIAFLYVLAGICYDGTANYNRKLSVTYITGSTFCGYEPGNIVLTLITFLLTALFSFCPELILMFYAYLLLFVEISNADVKKDAVNKQPTQPSSTYEQIQNSNGVSNQNGAGSRFDAIRPRIHFPIKYKAIPTDKV